MNINKIQAMTQGMSDRAVTTGLVREADGVYTLNFNPSTSCYDVIAPDGTDYVSFRTYKITEAKRWLREYING